MVRWILRNKTDIERVVESCIDDGACVDAARVIYGMGPEATGALVASAREAARRRRRTDRLLVTLQLSTLAVLSGLLALDWSGLVSIADHPLLWPGLYVFLTFLIFASGWSIHLGYAGILCRIDDVRAVGPLLQLWEMEETRTVVEEPLTRLLPRLRAGDAALLDQHQRRFLQLLLVRAESTLLVLAALRALEQIGEDADYPTVARVARGGCRAGRYARVRAAASGCLEYLAVRIESERARRTLLRPADHAGPGLLLHPALADADLLLRPIEDE